MKIYAVDYVGNIFASTRLGRNPLISWGIIAQPIFTLDGSNDAEVNKYSKQNLNAAAEAAKHCNMIFSVKFICL
jgi:hypothetical protein